MRRRRKKHTKLKALLVLFSIILLLGLVIYKIRYSPSKKQADLNEYFNINSDSEVAIVLNGDISDTKGLMYENNLYLPTNFVFYNITPRVYYEATLGAMIYSKSEGNLVIYDDKYIGYYDKADMDFDYIPFHIEPSGETYIALKFIEDKTSSIITSDMENRVVSVISDFNSKDLCKVKKNGVVRSLTGIKSDVLTKVKKGEEVEFIEDIDAKWSKVITVSGYTGYIEKRKLSKSYDGSYEEVSFNDEVYSKINNNEKVKLGWHQVTNMDANSTINEVLGENVDINVISPTWFFLSDTNGNIHSLASKEYVDYAHEKGIKVWALINDFDGASLFGGPSSSEEINTILGIGSNRNNLINNILYELRSNNIDGINVDFENISENMSMNYLQFIRELSFALHKEGYTVSVDNYMPKYTPQYNRKEEAVFVDFIILMGYDENGHWSNTAGPVASMPFVKEGVETTLNRGVDPSQIILGMPFYTRHWYMIDGNTYCETLSMEDSLDVIEENDGTISFDSTLGLNYATWIENEIAMEAWIEDKTSISEKITYAKEKNLGGIAFWKLSQERDDIWSEINNY